MDAAREDGQGNAGPAQGLRLDGRVSLANGVLHRPPSAFVDFAPARAFTQPHTTRMTSSPQAIGRIVHATPAPARAAVIGSSAWTDARVFTGTMILLAAMFLLLQNRYWVPG